MDYKHRETSVPCGEAPHKRHVSLVVVLAAGLLLVCPVSLARAASVEAKVKSAYLYNLLRRTTWPDSMFEKDDSPYRVAVLGQDNLEGLLEKIAEKKKVNKRSIQLHRLKSLDDLREPYHMLYVPGEYLSPEQQQAILKKTANMPCLVVGDAPGFAEAGASANFYERDDGTMGIQLNRAEAAQHQLKFDQQLLEVAKIVSP